MSDLRHICRICVISVVFAELDIKPGFFVIVNHQPGKEDAVMNDKVMIRERLLMTILKSIHRAAVRGAGKPSYKGAFEAEVPNKLKRQE